jgi:hypothetical protein
LVSVNSTYFALFKKEDCQVLDYTKLEKENPLVLTLGGWFLKSHK